MSRWWCRAVVLIHGGGGVKHDNDTAEARRFKMRSSHWAFNMVANFACVAADPPPTFRDTHGDQWTDLVRAAPDQILVCVSCRYIWCLAPAPGHGRALPRRPRTQAHSHSSCMRMHARMHMHAHLSCMRMRIHTRRIRLTPRRHGVARCQLRALESRVARCAAANRAAGALSPAAPLNEDEPRGPTECDDDLGKSILAPVWASIGGNRRISYQKHQGCAYARASLMI